MNDFGDGELDQRIRELERVLSSPPIFRSVPTGRPLVYGYIRSHQVRACGRVLERYCWRERLRLCGVFVDDGIAADVTMRPGFSGLCDVLRLPDSYGAVTVSLAHLSSDATIADLLAHRVRATGARLLVARTRPPLGHPANTASSRAHGT
jgi:hypothetical protein